MIRVFSKAGGACPWCRKAAELLDAKGYDYEEIELESLQELAAYGARAPPGHATFPCVEFDGECIGGYRELCEKIDVKHVLAFFAGSDGIVMENLAANFATEVQIPEARQFYACQMMIEAIHSESYALLIDALADPKEALGLFRAIETLDPVRKKAAWAQRYLDRRRPFAERLVAFVCVEGILFSGSFCAIYWLKRRGVMPGLTLSNEFISRDEALHYAFGVALYKLLRHKAPEATVAAIVREAVETELDFVVDAIPCRLVGMNADMMRQYIKFVADRAMLDLGYGKLYGVDNPFPWMDLIGLQGKTNFFEQFPSQYQRAGVLAESSDQVFGTDDDF